MNPLRFLLLVISLMGLTWTASADVNEYNSTPCTLKYVVVKQLHFTNSVLTSCPTFETSIAYGESLILLNHYESGPGYTVEIRYEKQYSYDVPAPCPPASNPITGLSLVTGTGWEFAPNIANGTANIFYNMGSDVVTLQARDNTGSIASSGVEWHVTDLINDVVTHDWASLSSITFGNLVAGRAMLVRSRRTGGVTSFEAELSFAAGDWSYGPGGKKNQPDSTFPYGAQRKGGCALGCLRNVLNIKGKQVYTEDEIVQILVQNGKPEADFLTDSGMGHSEAEQRFNQVLNSRGLKATNRDPITRDQIIAKLGSGQTLIVGIEIWVGDPRDPANNPLRKIKHMIVMRKVNSKVEILDPLDGTSKKRTMDEAMALIDFGGAAQITSRIWEIDPLNP